MAIEVFISYSHKDQAFREELEIHLSNLKRQNIISSWYDGDITPGAEWEPQIMERLTSAQLILLLISADFIHSDFCYSIEMKQAIDRHNAGEARVIPIVLRPTDWQGAPFAKLKMLPTDAKAVTSWLTHDEAFLDIVQGIRKAIDDLTHPGKTVNPSLASGTTASSTTQVSIWNVHYQRNPLFTGREHILERLATMFHAGKTTALAQPLAISGLGGIGKTQTAIEYAYRYREQYRQVLWARADTRENLIQEYVALAEFLQLPEQHLQDQPQIVEAVKRWLREQRQWLLILDNADDLAMLRDFLPEAYTGHILLTTRAQAMGRLARRIELDRMQHAEGTLFLLRRAGMLEAEEPLDQASSRDQDTALAIVQEMDGLPLALDQAGAFIEETKCSLTDYLQLYRSQRADLLKARGGLVSDHPEPVATTWSLSFANVQKRSENAADLLRVCAFLHPDAIPEEIFTEGATALGHNLQVVAQNPLAFNQAIGVLLSYSLVKRQPEEHLLSMHRLVQAVILDELDEETQRRWVERVVQAVSQVFPREEPAPWPQSQRYLAQALVCEALINRWNLILTEAIAVLYNAGRYLEARWQDAEAEPLLREALAIGEKRYGVDHPDTSKLLHTLAVLYSKQGKEAEAEPLLQRVLAIREKTLGPEHPDIAQTLNALAVLYSKQGKEAESLFQRALAIREKTLGPEHPDIAYTLNSLAVLYDIQGKHEEAEALFQRALAIRERMLGLEHPDTAHTLRNLAILYKDQGKEEEAESLFQRALAIYEKTFGIEHPYAAQTLNSLANLYYDQGKYAEAEPLYRRALRIWEQVLGPDHLSTAAALGSLARLYQDQGNYAQAEPLYRRILRIREQQVNSNPNDAAAYLGRGYAYLLLKKSEDACADFAKYTALRPKDVNAAWMVVYAALGKERPGVEIAERLEVIAELDSQSDEAYVCRGVALELRGKLQEGLAELEHPLSLDAENEDAWFWKGVVCACLGRDTTAMESIEQALKAGLPPILLTPLFWLEQDSPNFYQEYAEPLLKRYELI